MREELQIAFFGSMEEADQTIKFFDLSEEGQPTTDYWTVEHEGKKYIATRGDYNSNEIL